MVNLHEPESSKILGFPHAWGQRQDSGRRACPFSPCREMDSRFLSLTPAPAKDVFSARKIGADQLPSASPRLRRFNCRDLIAGGWRNGSQERQISGNEWQCRGQPDRRGRYDAASHRNCPSRFPQVCRGSSTRPFFGGPGFRQSWSRYLTRPRLKISIMSVRVGAPPVRGKGSLPPNQVCNQQCSAFFQPALSGLQALRRKHP